jgi:peptide/nickel transport system permease protein
VPGLLLVVLVVVGIFAPWISPHDPLAQDLSKRLAPPLWYPEGSSDYLLGADHVGRDLLSRVIHGARVSLVVAAISLSSGLIVGTSLGLIAGYFGGIADEIITRVVDVWFALPFILIALVTVIIFGASFSLVMILLALVTWAPFVRFIRGDVLSLKERDYVALARVAGASDWRIMIRHLLPGTLNTMIVVATLRVGQLILTEATLSFIGAGIPSPRPAWGLMVAEARDYVSTAWWGAAFPGLAIFLVVMSMNFIGDWLRDRLDPRLRQIS